MTVQKNVQALFTAFPSPSHSSRRPDLRCLTHSDSHKAGWAGNAQEAQILTILTGQSQWTARTCGLLTEQRALLSQHIE